MAMMIPVSFKKDEKWLYDLVCQSGDKSNYIKDILKLHYSNSKPAEKVDKEVPSEQNNTSTLAIDSLLSGLK